MEVKVEIDFNGFLSHASGQDKSLLYSVKVDDQFGIFDVFVEFKFDHILGFSFDFNFIFSSLCSGQAKGLLYLVKIEGQLGILDVFSHGDFDGLTMFTQIFKDLKSFVLYLKGQNLAVVLILVFNVKLVGTF